MKKLHSLVVSLALVALVACSGSSSTGTNNNNSASASSSVDVGSGTGDAQSDSQSATTASFTVFSQVLSSVFSGGSVSALVKGQPQWNTVDFSNQPCSQSGTYSVTGTYNASGSTYSYDFNVTYNDCDGLNGSLDYSGDYNFTDLNNSTYRYTTNGTYGGYGCSVTYTDLVYEFTMSGSSYSITFDGGLSSTCGTYLYECNFNNVTVSDFYSAYTDSCTLTDESGSTVSSDDVSPFFEDVAGTYTFVASDDLSYNGGTSDTTFTENQTYTVTVSSSGVFTIQTNNGTVTIDYNASSNDSATYEAYSHEDYVIIVANGVRFLFQRHFGDFSGVAASYSEDTTDYANIQFSWYLGQE